MKAKFVLWQRVTAVPVVTPILIRCCGRNLIKRPVLPWITRRFWFAVRSTPLLHWLQSLSRDKIGAITHLNAPLLNRGGCQNEQVHEDRHKVQELLVTQKAGLDFVLFAQNAFLSTTRQTGNLKTEVKQNRKSKSSDHSHSSTKLRRKKERKKKTKPKHNSNDKITTTINVLVMSLRLLAHFLCFWRPTALAVAL